ncbi:hypothetical protein J2S47_000762 [Streptomyces griseoviridis]|uniref:Uncharacterized protein n=1 Tax=Streptomyces griseoviridis TaxID=45398 RepID=A0ABT9L983_STRGD|nr:hypothetical protein [Streptomyces griseoviridis]
MVSLVRARAARGIDGTTHRTLRSVLSTSVSANLPVKAIGQ